MFSLENFGANKLGSTTFITGPARYREVQENQTNESFEIAGANSATLNSYDKTAN